MAYDKIHCIYVIRVDKYNEIRLQYTHNKSVRVARAQMIFGEIQSNKHYSKLYPELLRFISCQFKNVDAGIQGDAWIYISKENQSVHLDTFTSMNFEVKAKIASRSLALEVLEASRNKFSVVVYQRPELEFHEE